MQTNCPNCGAPLDLDRVKCPYCGTRYYDMAIADGEPFYLRYKINDKTFIAKCIVDNCDVSAESSSSIKGIRGGLGNAMLFVGPPEVDMRIHMDYTVIQDDDKTFAHIIQKIT